MKTYKIYTQFVFNGYFKVKAENRKEAEEIVENDCGMVLGCGISSTDDNVDWEYDIHPDKKIKRKKASKV